MNIPALSAQSCHCSSNFLGVLKDGKVTTVSENAAERASCFCHHRHTTRPRVCNFRLALLIFCISFAALIIFFATPVYPFFKASCSRHLSGSVKPATNENSDSADLTHPQTVDVIEDTWAFGGYLRSGCPSDQNPVNEGGSTASGCLQTSTTNPENMFSYTFYTARTDSNWAVCLFTSKNCQGILRQGNPFTANGCITNKAITLSARVIDPRTQTCRSPFK